MKHIFDQMLAEYSANSLQDRKNAVKEVMQEIVLCGLSRAGFFREAAFYGGTALRIFYGLNRFSEDLDFSLMVPNSEFDIERYCDALKREVRAFGLNVSVEPKVKSVDSDIKSAFIKGNTIEHMLVFYGDESIKGIHNNEMIKLEVDVNPPDYATFVRRYRLLPMPYEINMYDEASLFAGKVHAVICRAWKNRVKGRDLYDYVFYITKGIPVNRMHLAARLVQSGYVSTEDECTEETIRNMLRERFAQIDYNQAKQDVLPFISSDREVDLWSEAFFAQISDNIKFI